MTVHTDHIAETLGQSFEDAPIAIAVVGLDGSMVRINRAAERLVGRSDEELRGKSYLEVGHPEDNGTASRVEAVLRGEAEMFAYDKRLLRSDGGVVWTRIHLGPLRDRGGELIGGIVYVDDITDRRTAEAAARDAREQATEASRGKTDFLTRVSHEFRAPLTAILGYAELLEADLEGRDARDARRIRLAASHMGQMLDDVADMALIEAGRFRVAAEPVDVDPVVDEAIALVLPLARPAGTEVDCEPSGLRVTADRGRLRQVLTNLLSNAIKYGPGGSVVRVATEARDGCVRISVKDTGPGIPASDTERIFLPFERLATGEQPGTGLGLTLSKRFVEAMGGSIGVDSGPDGSTFWFELPALS